MFENFLEQWDYRVWICSTGKLNLLSMQFICDEWGERHILAYDKNLFLWQYGREEYADKTGINMVLMLSLQSNLSNVRPSHLL